MSDDSNASATVFADLRIRVLAAVGLGVVAITALWLGGLVLLVFAAAAVCLMLLELNSMCQSHGDITTSAGYAVVVGGTLAVLATYHSVGAVMVLLGLAMVISWVLNERRFDWRAAAITAAVVLAGAAIYSLRQSEGFWVVLWIALCVVAADTGGYLFGRIIGGPKLSPKISPKKTWSGFLGGIGLTVIVAVIFAVFQNGNMTAYIVLALVIAVVALAGDLFESAAKRYYGVKDSGTIMPGHGGLMDRFDGLSLVYVFFFIFANIGSLNAVLNGGYP